MGAEGVFDGCVREVTGGEHVRDVGTIKRSGVAGFGEVDVGEAAVLAGEFGERVEGLDDAGALRPTRADASGVGDDGAFAASEGGFAGGFQTIVRPRALPVGRNQVEEIGGGDVVDARGRG